MKIIITESKLNSTIYNYIDETFASKDGNPEIFKLDDITDSDGTQITIDFVNSDYYGEEGSNFLFNWTREEYFKLIYNQGVITKFEYENMAKETPICEITDRDVINLFNNYFGDLWKPVFKQWFKDKTGMDYKTLYLG